MTKVAEKLPDRKRTGGAGWHEPALCPSDQEGPWHPCLHQK